MCDLVKGTEDEAFCFLTRFVYGKKKKNCCLRNAISIRMFKLHTKEGILKDTHGDRLVHITHL